MSSSKYKCSLSIRLEFLNANETTEGENMSDCQFLNHSWLTSQPVKLNYENVLKKYTRPCVLSIIS